MAIVVASASFPSRRIRIVCCHNEIVDVVVVVDNERARLLATTDSTVGLFRPARRSD